MRQKWHGVGGGKAARAAAGVFFQRINMWRAIRPQEIRAVPRGRRTPQRQPVLFAFSDRQAILMRLNTAHQQVIAVQDQVVGGDRGRQIGPLPSICHALFGRDMLHHHAQFGQAAAQRV